jgi:pectate lyase
VFQYSKPIRRMQPPDGPLTGTLTYSSYGDRAENQFGKDFPDVANEGWVLFNGAIYTNFALVQMEVAEKLGEPAKELLSTTVDGIKAYIKYAYNQEENNFRPLWADGTDLTGYAFPRTGYYGPEGRVLQPAKANDLYLFSFSRAYRHSRDENIWQAIRSIMSGLDLGDPGKNPDIPSGLNLNTKNSNPNALFAILELHKATKNNQYLLLAEIIGDNMIKRSFHHGFFLQDENHINAKFDAIEPLALLALEAALRGKPELVPTFSGGDGYIHGQFDDLGRTYDSRAIWGQKREHTKAKL